MLIGIMGLAQSGKDSIAHILGESGWQRIAFADPLKRLCMKLFGFTEDQLWGTNEQKNAPNERYPREHTWAPNTPTCLCCGQERGHGPCYLTARYALKIVGTEGVKHCYPNFWINQALWDADRLQNEMGLDYRRTVGVIETGRPQLPQSVAIPDTRFKDEVVEIRRRGGRIYRVRRPGFDNPAFNHASETEQLSIPDTDLDGVIWNSGTLQDLRDKVRRQILAC